jgi:hypothetical protein
MCFVDHSHGHGIIKKKRQRKTGNLRYNIGTFSDAKDNKLHTYQNTDI